MRKDIKARYFKKGDMVRLNFDKDTSNALGIVTKQEGMKVYVSWVAAPWGAPRATGVYNAYHLAKVEKDAD